MWNSQSAGMRWKKKCEMKMLKSITSTEASVTTTENSTGIGRSNSKGVTSDAKKVNASLLTTSEESKIGATARKKSSLPRKKKR